MLTTRTHDWLPGLRFFRAFSSVLRRMPGYTPQRRGTARTIPNFCVVLCCSMYLCVVLYIVCFVPLSVLFVCICVLYYCHRVATQLHLNISYHIIYHYNNHQTHKQQQKIIHNISNSYMFQCRGAIHVFRCTKVCKYQHNNHDITIIRHNTF